jgi:hypothetical protein
MFRVLPDGCGKIILDSSKPVTPGPAVLQRRYWPDTKREDVPARDMVRLCHLVEITDKFWIVESLWNVESPRRARLSRRLWRAVPVTGWDAAA